MSQHSAPLSILQLAGGALPRRATLAESVLVIVDAQNEYVSGKLPLPGVTEAIAEIAHLLTSARSTRTPVIHVVQHSAPGRALFDPQTTDADIVPQLAPISGEQIIVKKLPNAFAGTNLEASLKAIAAETGRKTILLVGFMTHMCISATARAALDLGIEATVVASACATRDIPSPFGGVIPAYVVHETALAEIADRFACVVPDAASAISALEKQRVRTFG